MTRNLSGLLEPAPPTPAVAAAVVTASIRLGAECRHRIRSDRPATGEVSSTATAHQPLLLESGVALQPPPCPLEWCTSTRAEAPAPAEAPTSSFVAGFRVAARTSLGSECRRGVRSDWAFAAETAVKAGAETLGLLESGMGLQAPPVSLEWLAAAEADHPVRMDIRAGTQVRLPVQGELIRAQGGSGPAGAEALAGCRAAPTIPQETVFAVSSDLPILAAAGADLRPDSGAMIEAQAAAMRESTLLELLGSPESEARLPLEGSVIALIDADALAPVEAMAALQCDGATGSECRGTYVVSVTLTLSDGRVLTFPAVPCVPLV